MKQHTSREYPSPVTVAALRAHFADKYQLDEEHIELMLQSSKDSLQAVFVRTDTASGDQPFDFHELKQIGHSLRGLFLNLGEARWAEVARKMEQGANQQQSLQYSEMFEAIREGVQEILEYRTK